MLLMIVVLCVGMRFLLVCWRVLACVGVCCYVLLVCSCEKACVGVCCWCVLVCVVVVFLGLDRVDRMVM